MPREKKVIVKEFNEELAEFLKEMAPKIGSTYHKVYRELVKFNILLGIEQFRDYVESHKKEIRNKNESYFLDQDTQQKILGDDAENSVILQEIKKIGEIYSGLNSSSKEAIWDYFNLFLDLCEEYYDL